MHKAIIFDMDGVIAHSEGLWNEKEPDYLRKILTPSAAHLIIGNTRGLSESLIYAWAKKLGFSGSREEFYNGYDRIARNIYATCPITAGMDALFGELKAADAVVGLVSSSPMDWIRIVLSRLQHRDVFRFVESVNEHPELQPKPAPDGYIAAMKALNVHPKDTLIIEDSQTGINAGIASGANVCCFAQHVDTKRMPTGVTQYAHTIEELRSACLAFLAPRN
ncbi:HAD family phosphatase [Patescibacteria group bacterium]|nr:HAD family phosphatase [Patescibacteria group bacterium]